MKDISCDKRGHIMSPTSPRCVVCGVYSSQMMLVTREVHEQTRQRLAAAEAARDVLLACRHGDQRCFECPDTTCCDNLNEAAKGERDE